MVDLFGVISTGAGIHVENSEKRGAPDRIRTCDPQIRNLVLYPTELRAHSVGDSSKVSGLVA
jgi:hypothetical protein